MAQTLSQRRFIRGLNASTTVLSQPPGSLPRISNFMLEQRGGLTTTPGSKLLFAKGGIVQQGDGAWLDITLFQPVGAASFYLGLKREFGQNLGAPTGLATADGGAGGTLPALGTNYWKVTALDNSGFGSVPNIGETTASNEANFTQGAASHKVILTWNHVANVSAYAVYRGTAPGNELLLTIITWAQGATDIVTFTDDGSLTPGLFSPPTSDNSHTIILYNIPGTSASYTIGSNKVAALATTTIPILNIYGAYDVGGQVMGTGVSTGNPPTPYGGMANSTSPLPQIIPFNNKALLALGNGFTPQIFTSPNSLTAITNTFTAVYPNWTATTTYNAGDLIEPQTNNAGNFVFKAFQAGISGSVNPTFPQTQGQTVTDGKVIWVNQGVTTTSPAPRGAAHGISYQGSMWLYNTSPTTTADQLDGPTCLKSSDINNLTSWNPLNTAFIGKDDGTQGTGLATFSIAAEGIAPTDSLVAFKEFSTYQIIGVFGAPNFAIQQAQTDLGCIAPRSIQFLPGFGIARLSHLGVAVFDGIRDKLISEEIRPYLFGSEQDIIPIDWSLAYFSKACENSTPPSYLLACPLLLTVLSGVFPTVVAGASSFLGTEYWLMVTKFTNFNGVIQETQISGLFPIGRMDNAHGINVQAPFDAKAIKYRVYIGNTPLCPNNYTEFTDLFVGGAGVNLFSPGATAGMPNNGLGGLNRLFIYDLVLKCWTIIDIPWAISVSKQIRASGAIPLSITGAFSDDSIRRIQANDLDWDGTAINWSVQTPEVFGKNTDQRMNFRRFVIRGEYTGATPTINFTLSSSQQSQNTVSMRVISQGVFGSVTQFAAYADISLNSINAHGVISGSGQIEIYSFDWELTPMAAGVPVTI